MGSENASSFGVGTAGMLGTTALALAAAAPSGAVYLATTGMAALTVFLLSLPMVADDDKFKPIPFVKGAAAGFIGALTLAFGLATSEAPKALGVSANDTPAIAQNQSGMPLSCKEIAKKCDLELK